VLHDLANGDGYVALKRVAEDRMETQNKDVKNLLWNRRLLMMKMMMIMSPWSI